MSLYLCYTNSSFSPYVRIYKIKYTHIVQIFTAFIYCKYTYVDLNIHPAWVCCIYAQYIWCPCTRTCNGNISLNRSRMFVFKHKIFSYILNMYPLWGLRHIEPPSSIYRGSAIPKGRNQPGGLRPSQSKGHICVFCIWDSTWTWAAVYFIEVLTRG